MRQLRALDLFTGLGGWLDGLVLEGFDVVGVEIDPKIAALNKHRVIVADVCELNPEDFKGYDLIVGSPPCRNFSRIAIAGKNVWKVPPDPEGEGMRLVKAFINFVEVAQPRYWLMENVPGLQRYYGPAKTETYISQTMKRCFWGNFPFFLVPRDFNKGILSGGRNRATGEIRKPTHKYDYSGKLRAWERAKIPLPVARALGVAVRQALEN